MTKLLDSANEGRIWRQQEGKDLFGKPKQQLRIRQFHKNEEMYSFCYISNKMQLYTVHLFLENCFTCFGWDPQPSSGAHTTVFTVYGNC